MQVPVLTICYTAANVSNPADRIATGFPLPSTGRGIEGEGWSYPEPPPARASGGGRSRAATPFACGAGTLWRGFAGGLAHDAMAHQGVALAGPARSTAWNCPTTSLSAASTLPVMPTAAVAGASQQLTPVRLPLPHRPAGGVSKNAVLRQFSALVTPRPIQMRPRATGSASFFHFQPIFSKHQTPL